MDPYFQDAHVTLYCGDCRDVLQETEPESVQMCVTSPPYWGLRKYAGIPDSVWADGWRGQFGLEPTVEMYVQHTVEMLRAIRRVLRKDGVVFWNVGDSYASGKGTCFNPGGGASSFNGHSSLKDAQAYPLDRGNKSTLNAQGLKPKDLCLIPFRVALAAQADGWWVRSDIIWSKPNPMPESVQDRPTDAYEHILMLTKSARYYWDTEAVKEESNPESLKRYQYAYGSPSQLNREMNETVPKGDRSYLGTGRNLRNFWIFPTQPYKGHFATFPLELPLRCIKAATSEKGACPKCGKPWERQVERTAMVIDRSSMAKDAGIRTLPSGTMVKAPTSKTIGWGPSCDCSANETVPCVVLDPFAGIGTVGEAAKKLGRKAILIELSEDYCKLAVERLRRVVLL